jgi:hypothetical protein
LVTTDARLAKAVADLLDVPASSPPEPVSRDL